MSCQAIIFSNIHNETIEELSRQRTTASIPFAAKYRIIDFLLSACINANITKVGVLANKNYQSLMEHIGTGSDWDLARKVGGLTVFPPFSSYRADYLYDTRFEALQSIKNYISKGTEENVLITDCDSINTLDLEDVLNFHKEKDADVTYVYKNLKVTKDLTDHMALDIDNFDQVTNAKLHATLNKKQNVFLNIVIIKKDVLLSLMDKAINNDGESFHKDVLFANINNNKMYGYNYSGLYFHLTSLDTYYKCNMEVLKDEVREELFMNPERRVYTKVRDSAPTKYLEGSRVENSVLADGCVIEGEVVNSILFRGVHVAKGTVVKNSILMQDTILEENVMIDHVITDKNVVVRSGNNLCGCEDIPYYIGKSVEVKN